MNVMSYYNFIEFYNIMERSLRKDFLLSFCQHMNRRKQRTKLVVFILREENWTSVCLIYPGCVWVSGWIRWALEAKATPLTVHRCVRWRVEGTPIYSGGTSKWSLSVCQHNNDYLHRALQFIKLFWQYIVSFNPCNPMKQVVFLSMFSRARNTWLRLSELLTVYSPHPELEPCFPVSWSHLSRATTSSCRGIRSA